ncbi:MAG: acyltransferase [Terracidiphilus sp.]
MAAPTESRRLYQLDSLRGIAALCVVLHHLFWLWKDEVLSKSPASFRGLIDLLLQPISAGHEAVILFFILSGLVLSIPAQVGKPQTYPVFLTRRIFRIYFPYLVAVMLAVIGNSLLCGSVTISPWFQKFWLTPVHRSDVLQHIAFLGSFNTDQFDPPVWSLVHEMRISLVFPFLCWVALAIKPARLLLISFFISVACIFYAVRFPQYYSYLCSLHYIAFFVTGICIFYYSRQIGEHFVRWSRDSKYLLLGVAVLIYSYPGKLLTIDKTLAQHIDPQLAVDWTTAIGASLFIVISLNSIRAGKILLSKPALWLGEMSYSLYLIHFVVLLVLVHLLYGKLNITLLLFICLIASLAVARVFFVAVERPCMNLGRRLSKLMTRKLQPVATL